MKFVMMHFLLSIFFYKFSNTNVLIPQNGFTIFGKFLTNYGISDVTLSRYHRLIAEWEQIVRSV
jgi:hypothetical protein